MISKKVLLPVTALAIVGVVLFGIASTASAQTNTPPFSGLAQMLAQKFGLNQNEVQSVINEYHKNKTNERIERMQQNLSNKLDQLVKHNKISADQKTAIENEINTLKNKYHLDNLQNMTREEQRTAMQNAYNEFQTWAKANNIDLSDLHIGFGMGMEKGGMMGMRMHRGFDNDGN